MANLVATASTEITLDDVLRKFSPTITQTADEFVEVRVDIDDSDIPIQVLGLDTASKAVNSLDDFKYLGIENVGDVPMEVMIKLQQYKDGGVSSDVYVPASGDANDFVYMSNILKQDEFMVLPNPRVLVYNELTSAANASSVSAELSSITTDKDGNASGTDFGNDHNSGTARDTNGIVPGSIAIKFYDQGYAEFGLTGVTNDTDSGLTASTLYDIKITFNGSLATVSFTTDSSNVKIGGTNGILSKIQDAIDALGGTTERKGVIEIVNGDIRVTSNSNLSTSAIILTDGVTNTMLGVGIFPAQASLPSPVDGSTTDFTDGVYDDDDVVYDDGNGNLVRVNGGSGTIEYDEAGDYELIGCPTDGEFKLYCRYDSAHSGDNETTANKNNILPKIYARSMNSELDSKIRLVAFN